MRFWSISVRGCMLDLTLFTVLIKFSLTEEAGQSICTNSSIGIRQAEMSIENGWYHQNPPPSAQGMLKAFQNPGSEFSNSKIWPLLIMIEKG